MFTFPMGFLHVFYHLFHVLFALTHRPHKSNWALPPWCSAHKRCLMSNLSGLEHEEGRKEPTCIMEEGVSISSVVFSDETKLCEKLGNPVVSKDVSENSSCKCLRTLWHQQWSSSLNLALISWSSDSFPN